MFSAKLQLLTARKKKNPKKPEKSEIFLISRVGLLKGMEWLYLDSNTRLISLISTSRQSLKSHVAANSLSELCLSSLTMFEWEINM